jgi:hypothetical protein
MIQRLANQEDASAVRYGTKEVTVGQICLPCQAHFMVLVDRLWVYPTLLPLSGDHGLLKDSTAWVCYFGLTHIG